MAPQRTVLRETQTVPAHTAAEMEKVLAAAGK
jgi:hypothetical protein